jgi:hypothetical protein
MMPVTRHASNTHPDAVINPRPETRRTLPEGNLVVDFDAKIEAKVMFLKQLLQHDLISETAFTSGLLYVQAGLNA